MTALFPDEPELGPPLPVGLGRAIAGGAGSRPRQANDFYPTPPLVTRALIAAERHSLRGACGHTAPLPVWEPCARGGAILAELRVAGFACVGTDIVADPEHDVAQADLLSVRRAKSPVVMTNPPFALAAPMIRHLLGALRVDWCALLLKASFWHAAERTGLFRAHPPQRIHALNWRPDFLGGGNPTMEVMWCVWDRGCAMLGTRYDVLGPALEPGLFEGADA